MRKKKKKTRKKSPLLILVIIFLVIGMGLGLILSKIPLEIEDEPVLLIAKPSSAKLLLPAIDNEGNGVAVDLLVETKPGNQRILTNIDKLLFWVDTQFSIQTAKEVAEKLTDTDTEDIDIIYSLDTDTATLIGGPSAGAALTIATIAVFQNKTLDESVMITGTIEPDGTIGPVGGIFQKATAAKEIGATKFLVPLGEGTEIRYKPVEECTETVNFVYCETNYQRTEVDISESVGLDVIEVSTIEEAMLYFF
jgi:uncharacterized protein